MEQAFSDACVALCLNERPVSRVAQSCRAAAVEMPRPTVRRWCEHGYNVAFSKTSKDLATHFKPIRQAEAEPVATEEVIPDPVVEEVESVTPVDVKESVESAAASSRTTPNRPLRGVSPQASSVVVATIPVTIEDKTTDLVVLEGQNPEEAVVAFCRTHVPDDVSSCIRQLLTTVLDKIAEGDSV